MKRLLLALVMAGLLADSASAQVTIPNTFTSFTLITASSLNANFAALGNNALNRTGGTITGNITVSGGITIDGADISAYLSGGKLIATDTSATSLTVGGGITAGSGVVGIVDTTGKIPALSSTYFASLSGANLTSLPAANLTGTITSATQDLITRTGTVISGTWSSAFGAVSGANLITLNASNIGSGTVATARLGSGVADATTYLRGDSTWATVSIPAIPSNIVAFSSTGSCPSGWTEYTAGRGFVYVGLPSGGTNAGTVGSALTNLENRTHSHSVPGLSFTGPSFSTTTDGGHAHSYTTGGPSSTVSVVTSSGTGSDVTTSVASGSHSHSGVSDTQGSHSHSGTANGATTSGGTSGTASTSSVLPYIQLIGCQKT